MPTIDEAIEIRNYIWWDTALSRWDVTNLALIEQGNPLIHSLINLVVRSWFIPPKLPGKTKD